MLTLNSLTKQRLLELLNEVASERDALRTRNDTLEAQIAAFKKANGEMANALHAHNEATQLGTGCNR